MQADKQDAGNREAILGPQTLLGWSMAFMRQRVSEADAKRIGCKWETAEKYIQTHPTVTKLIDYNEFCGIRGEEKPVGSGVPEIQVEELKRRLDAKDDLFVLDVREPHEYQICNLGGYLIPLNDLPKRINELEAELEASNG